MQPVHVIELGAKFGKRGVDLQRIHRLLQAGEDHESVPEVFDLASAVHANLENVPARGVGLGSARTGPVLPHAEHHACLKPDAEVDVVVVIIRIIV